MWKKERFAAIIGYILDGLTWNIGYMKCPNFMVWNLCLSGWVSSEQLASEAVTVLVGWEGWSGRLSPPAGPTACWTSPRGWQLKINCTSLLNVLLGAQLKAAKLKQMYSEMPVCWPRGGACLPLCEMPERGHWLPVQPSAQSRGFIGVDLNTTCFEQKCKWYLQSIYRMKIVFFFPPEQVYLLLGHLSILIMKRQE